MTSVIKVHTSENYDTEKALDVLALWDTGATRSCITKCVAEELGLIPSTYKDSYGVSGVERVPVYDIIVDINESVKGIHLLVAEAKLNKNDGGSPNSDLGFLLGMDVIGLGDFFTGHYMNESNLPCSMFSYRFPSANDSTDYLQEIREYNREVQKKQTQNNRSNFVRKRH
ncbi:MAG: hypothetical protein IKS35_00900 [Clostridia bacterium]|nr:hypothetical protein [Clostridia bacterium]